MYKMAASCTRLCFVLLLMVHFASAARSLHGDSSDEEAGSAASLAEEARHESQLEQLDLGNATVGMLGGERATDAGMAEAAAVQRLWRLGCPFGRCDRNRPPQVTVCDGASATTCSGWILSGCSSDRICCKCRKTRPGYTAIRTRGGGWDPVYQRLKPTYKVEVDVPAHDSGWVAKCARKSLFPTCQGTHSKP